MQKFAEPIQTFFLFIHDQPFPRTCHDIQIAQKGETLDGTYCGRSPFCGSRQPFIEL
jgi:hypothetical protein